MRWVEANLESNSDTKPAENNFKQKIEMPIVVVEQYTEVTNGDHTAAN